MFSRSEARSSASVKTTGRGASSVATSGASLTEGDLIVHGLRFWIGAGCPITPITRLLARMRRQLEFDGAFWPGQARAHPYHYVSFEVPARCSRIEVAYHFAPVVETAEASTVDIGIFDVRGTEPLTGGFRGWSGSARRTFFIERETATPGFLPGPLPSGGWSIVLGGYEVPEGGLRWWLTVSLETGAGARSTSPRLVSRRKPRMAPGVSLSK
jgi:hypothetical protein